MAGGVNAAANYGTANLDHRHRLRAPLRADKLRHARVEDDGETPDPQHISTSYVERQNITMQMSMRRSTD